MGVTFHLSLAFDDWHRSPACFTFAEKKLHKHPKPVILFLLKILGKFS